MSRLKEIHDYLITLGKKEEDLKQLDEFSVYLSMEIMEYAHRNQKRVNGEDYANHPSRCFYYYRNLIGLITDDSYIDKDLLYENNIPYDGVQEVCLLHDVIEDTDFTIEELEEIFDECELGDYFRLYIKQALINITHIKNIDYLTYINICMENPISSICKMMDLRDNSNFLSLESFDDKNYKRSIKYIEYAYLINSKYHFVENINKYRKELQNEK